VFIVHSNSKVALKQLYFQHTKSNDGLEGRLCFQVVRLSSQDVPTAYAYELEAATIVQPEQVVEAVKNMVPKFAVA
jgi:pyruvate/2-oxoglutarate/acetoin dehydrogenase E1 component